MFWGALGQSSFVFASFLPVWRVEYPVDKMNPENQTSFIKFMQNKTFIEVMLYSTSIINGIFSSFLWVA